MPYPVADQNRPIFLLCLAFSAVILLASALLPSSVNGFAPLGGGWSAVYDNPVATADLYDRLDDSEFGRRPVVTRTQLWLWRYLDWPPQWSFNVLSFVFLLTSGWLIGLLARPLNGPSEAQTSATSDFPLPTSELHLPTSDFPPPTSDGPADNDSDFPLGVSPIKSVIAFYLTFSVCFAFLANICTYDDLAQYAFLLLALLLAERRRYGAAWGVLLLACITRETSLLFLPVFFMHEWRWKKSWWIGRWGLLPLAYGLWLWWWLPGSLLNEGIHFTVERRFQAYQINFRTWREAVESVMCAFLVLALPLRLAWQRRHTADPQLRFYLLAFGYLVLVNSALVWWAALAREARLFALPLIAWWPLAPLLLPADPLKKLWRAPPTRHLLGLGLGLLVSVLLYQPSVVGTGYLFRAYALGYIWLVVILWERGSNG